MEFLYEGFGPGRNVKKADSALRVEVFRGAVHAMEWTNIEAATGEKQPRDRRWAYQGFDMDIEVLMDGGARWVGAYSGDMPIGIAELVRLRGKAREKAIVARAISRLAYGPNDEAYVDGIFEEPEY